MTIIVLLILAGVTVASLTGENGLMGRTTEARAATVLGEAKDECALVAAEETEKYYEDVYVKQVSSPGNLDERILTEIQTTESKSKIEKNGVELTVKDTSKEIVLAYTDNRSTSTETGTLDNGKITWASTPTASGGGAGESSSTLSAGTYIAGQEVTFGGEQFFVVADDGDTVRLLAKYCLSKSSNEQVTASDDYNVYGISFSSINYWSSDFTSKPFDLQGDYLANHPLSSDETTANNAILKAQAYGETKGATSSRLMTYKEANAIVNGSDETMKKILFGTWTDGTAPTEGAIWNWLGAADSNSDVCEVNGGEGNLDSNDYDNDLFGVRPVLVVSES